MFAIEAVHTYKIFGKQPEAAIERLKSGAKAEDLRKEGTTAAVIDASFQVNEGEVFVVMGLSGSGKSTLIRMVNGLVEPTAGELRVYGDDVVAMNHQQLRGVRRERVSMVFQHFALFPHRSVGENAAYGLQIKGVSRDERERRAKEALRLVGLAGWEGSLPGQLSGGMRQRVGLARALAAGTDVLLMDEAFSALDPLIKREMQDQLVELQHKLGKTILFITHDLNEAMRLGDRIAMMREGRIVQIGTSEQILNTPANDYVATFVQDVDRSRVLTAGAVMTRPAALVLPEQGPGAVRDLMLEHHARHLFVVNRDRTLRGSVSEEAVTAALAAGAGTVDGVVNDHVISVSADARLSELLALSANTPHALAVVDDHGRVVGELAGASLLRSLGHGPAATATNSDDSSGDSPETPAPVFPTARMEVSRP